MFIISAAGMCVCMVIVAATGGSSAPAIGRVTCAFIFLYDFFYPLGFLEATFLFATEVAPLKVRIPITAIANATQWLFQFIVAQVTPLRTEKLGTHYYAIYAVINACIVPTVYLFFPETNGRSLEQMDYIFENSKSVFDPVKLAK